jgi:uncharacterized membrane protein
MSTYVGTQDLAASTEDARRERQPQRRSVFGMDAEKVATGLGWFSIGLGLAELIAPRTIAKIVGSRDHASLLRVYGMRELAAGIGLLTASNRAPWLWARVGGDAVDLTSLGKVAASDQNDRGKTIFGIASVAGVTALDVACALHATAARAGTWCHAEANIIVDRHREECYRFWRQFDNLPRVMRYIESVQTNGDTSHWIACAPGGRRVEWDSEIESDVPNERIAWRSLPGSDVRHSGSVNFESAPGGRGTIVRLQTDYGHAFRALEPLATFLGKHPEQLMRKALRRFKQVMETGEVITTEGQSSGRESGATWLDNIAR